jgi:hypothetical protein
VRLYHVSDQPGIARFEPRQAADGTLKVWAVEERTLANYLLPRECPRVCFRKSAGRATDLALLGDAEAMVAIEETWMERVQDTVLYRYEMPAETFVLEDHVAGYWTSRSAVLPSTTIELRELPDRIAEAGARLVAVASLWPLHDRVAESGLDFSMIRMRNAAPRG